MSECMQTDKPLISILMAVYEPRLDWLKEQLDSLEAQTYPNLRLYILDDCSSSVQFEKIRELAYSSVRSFSVTVMQNKSNVGSNITFERLTQEAEGDYFAYCDQDDIWLPEKLDVLFQNIITSNAQLICSDMFIINEQGRLLAKSITNIRRHHKFRSGEGLAEKLLVGNFVTGCTVLISADLAKRAVPFCPYMVHDHYLAFFAAERGSILSLNEPLIYYRVHHGNQTQMMAGVTDKESYFRLRIQTLVNRFDWLQKMLPDNDLLSDRVAEALQWAIARTDNFKGNWRAKKIIWRYRSFSPLTSLFEIFFSGAPEELFMWFIELKRKNVI